MCPGVGYRNGWFSHVLGQRDRRLIRRTRIFTPSSTALPPARTWVMCSAGGLYEYGVPAKVGPAGPRPPAAPGPPPGRGSRVAAGGAPAFGGPSDRPAIAPITASAANTLRTIPIGCRSARPV